MEYSVYPKNVSVWSLDIVGLRWEPLGTNQLYLCVCVCVRVQVCVCACMVDSVCVVYYVHVRVLWCMHVLKIRKNLPSNLTYLEAEEQRERLPQLPAMIEMGC